MAEKTTKLPETYWREALKRMTLGIAEMAQNPVPDTSFIDEFDEDKAQQSLEALERIQVLLENFTITGTLKEQGSQNPS